MQVQRTVLIHDKGRHQSVAEHIYSMIILANALYELKVTKLNYKKLIKHIIYHDIAEVEMNDTHIFDQDSSIDGKENEKKINIKVSQKLPNHIQNEYLNFSNEYLDLNSLEARYASGIDALDPMVLSYDVKENWIEFPEDVIRKYKFNRVKEFPEQLELFDGLIKGLKLKKFI